MRVRRSGWRTDASNASEFDLLDVKKSGSFCSAWLARTSRTRGYAGLMSDVTRILSQIESGDTAAADELLPLVYDELRKLASVKLGKESPGQTLQATALVHEAYIRLVGSDKQWHSSRHFFAAAAEAMRRILVDRARSKRSAKRGGGKSKFDLLDADCVIHPPSDELLALDEALSKLSETEAEMAELVKFRYFTGLTMDETAKALGISPKTVQRHWAYARAWLLREIIRGDTAVGE